MSQSLEDALKDVVSNGSPDEADLLNFWTRAAGAKAKLRSELSKKPRVSITISLSEESAERFHDRFWHIADDFLDKAHEIKFNGTDFGQSIFAFQSWATFSRFDHNSVDEQMFSAFEEATKECFGKENVTLLDLQNLSNLILDDEGVRGVYLCIGYGPEGEIAVYIGSTYDLLERLAKHNKCIDVADPVMDLYRTLSRPGWTHEWKVLARFPPQTHQCCSYMLESMLIVLGSLDNSRTSPSHPRIVKEWIDTLFQRQIYSFEPIKLNHCLPLRQGYSLQDSRTKTCADCGVTSDSEFVPNGQWYWKQNINPFELASYQCTRCYNYRLTSGKDRTKEMQQTHDVLLKAQIKRGVSSRGMPTRCDWCGSDDGKSKTSMCTELALCLCKCDRQAGDKHDGLPNPPERHSETLECEVCGDQPEDGCTYIPYPIKKFACDTCFETNAVHNELVMSQRRVDEAGEGYLALVEHIKEHPDQIDASFRDLALLPDRPSSGQSQKNKTKRKKKKVGRIQQHNAAVRGLKSKKVKMKSTKPKVPKATVVKLKVVKPKIMKPKVSKPEIVKPNMPKSKTDWNAPMTKNDILIAVRAWRGLPLDAELPTICDYCGVAAGEPGANANEPFFVNQHVRLALCGRDREHVQKDKPLHRFRQLDYTNDAKNDSGLCEICMVRVESTEWTFIPYPIKLLCCESCYANATPIVQELVDSRSRTRNTAPARLTYMDIVETIRNDPLCIPSELRNFALLPDRSREADRGLTVPANAEIKRAASAEPAVPNKKVKTEV